LVEVERERRALRGAEVPALEGAEDDVLDLICWRDDADRHLLQPEGCGGGEPFAAVQHNTATGDLERLDDPALGDVVAKPHAAAEWERRHVGVLVRAKRRNRTQFRRDRCRRRAHRSWGSNANTTVIRSRGWLQVAQ
jgi:hypothetical protein